MKQFNSRHTKLVLLIPFCRTNYSNYRKVGFVFMVKTILPVNLSNEKIELMLDGLISWYLAKKWAPQTIFKSALYVSMIYIFTFIADNRTLNQVSFRICTVTFWTLVKPNHPSQVSPALRNLEHQALEFSSLLWYRELSQFCITLTEFHPNHTSIRTLDKIQTGRILAQTKW